MFNSEQEKQEKNNHYLNHKPQSLPSFWYMISAAKEKIMIASHALQDLQFFY